MGQIAVDHGGVIKKGGIRAARQTLMRPIYLLIASPVLAPPLSIFTLITWIEFLSVYT